MMELKINQIKKGNKEKQHKLIQVNPPNP